LDNFASQLERSENVAETLQVITTSAVAALPGVDVASISVLTSDGDVETWAATDPIVLEVDAAQRELVEGPLYSRTDDEGRLAVTDIAAERRWPTYGPRIVELGIRSQVALTLRVSGRRRAILNLYATEPGAISAPRDLVEMFGAHAAMVIDFSDSVDQLSEALRSRKVIGQALGLVMGQYQMSEEQAFAYVRRISQDRNVKLRDVCAQLLADFQPEARPLGEESLPGG
jgi:GAF domain-containing protein